MSIILKSADRRNVLARRPMGDDLRQMAVTIRRLKQYQDFTIAATLDRNLSLMARSCAVAAAYFFPGTMGCDVDVLRAFMHQPRAAVVAAVAELLREGYFDSVGKPPRYRPVFDAAERQQLRDEQERHAALCDA